MTHVPQEPDASPPSGPPLLAPGDQVGRFRIEGVLGSGGMGEVYRAWDPALERSVALKALRAGGEREAGALERFRREALALAQLNHPHVCLVHEWVETDAGTFIAMEVVPGETLQQAAPKLAFRDRVKVILAVARALQAAHAKGLVHRDLKPANIMVSLEGGGEPAVKVLDFGLARLLDPDLDGDQETGPVPVLPELAAASAGDAYLTAPGSGSGLDLDRITQGPSGSPSWSHLTQAGSFVGSPAYASPEQIQGQAAGTASDIFSLGIVAWELFAGEPPFPGEGRARLKATLRGQTTSLRGRRVPRALQSLLRGMLDPRPFRRPAAGRVVRVLEHLLRPRGVWVWALASAAAALLAAGGAYILLGRGILAGLDRGKPARLAILPFVNETGLKDLDGSAHYVIPEMVQAALRSDSRLAPLGPDTLARARAALHLPSEGTLAPARETQLAKAVGADLILHGALRRDAGGALLLAFDLKDSRGHARLTDQVRVPASRVTVALPLARAVAHAIFRAAAPMGAAPRDPLKEVPAEALAAFARGQDQLTRGDFVDAAPFFQVAAFQAPDFVPAILGYARCLSRLAAAPPEPVFQWARWSAQAQGDRPQEVEALHSLMVRYGDRGQWEAADRTGEEALALAKTLENPAYVGDIRLTLGVHDQRRNRIAEAEAEYERALAIFRKLGDRLTETRVLNDLAVLQRNQGDLAGAEARYRGALATVRSFGDQWGEGLLLNNLGDLALAQTGGLDRAAALYQKAYALRRIIGDQTGLIYTCIGLASVAQARGDLPTALGYETQALDLTRKTGLRPMEGIALYNLGELNRDAGRYPSAMGFYRQSLGVHQALGDASMQAHALAGEAECLARQGRTVQARALLAQSRARSAEETPYILRAQAWVARAEGREADARALFQRALAAARTQAPEIVRELGAALQRPAGTQAAPRSS